MEDIAILVIVEDGEVTVKGPIGANVRVVNYDHSWQYTGDPDITTDSNGRAAKIEMYDVSALATEQERRECHYLRVLTGRD